jgi:hypothetical protein
MTAEVIATVKETERETAIVTETDLVGTRIDHADLLHETVTLAEEGLRMPILMFHLRAALDHEVEVHRALDGGPDHRLHVVKAGEAIGIGREVRLDDSHRGGMTIEGAMTTDVHFGTMTEGMSDTGRQ